MTQQHPDRGDAARRAAAEAARSARPPRPPREARPDASRESMIAPTPAQRALVPAVWGLTALVLALVLPLSAVPVLVVTAGVALVSWLLAGRSAVVLSDTDLVVRRPVGKVVVPLSDVREVERVRPVLTERAQVVRSNGRKLPLPAPQHGPAAALRDPAFDERLTLIRYRVAKGRS